MFRLTFPSFFFGFFFSDDHFFDALTARTCHGHPLPCDAAGTCVSEADAASVFAIGDFEYESVFHLSLSDVLMYGPKYAVTSGTRLKMHRITLH